MTTNSPAPSRVPGVHLLPDVPAATLSAEPMDVVGFVGVAPRGPAWERVDDRTWRVDAGQSRARSVAVAVESWDDYEERFGGTEGPGLLPHAVAAFFAQGGRRAWVVRVVPGGPVPLGDPPACTRLRLGPEVVTGAGTPVGLRARNEGTWGDRLQVTVGWRTRPVPVPRVEGASLVLPPGSALGVGDVVRLTSPGGARALRVVTATARRPHPWAPGADRLAVLDAAPAFPLAGVEVVEAVLDVVDADPRRARHERHAGLGLTPEHPRWAGAALEEASRLVVLADGVLGLLPADAHLRVATSAVEAPGADRSASITPDDVLGTARWTALGAEDAPPAGAGALVAAPDVATVVVPDLYSPAPLPERAGVADPPTLAGPGFAACLSLPPRVGDASPAAPELLGLRRDPAVPADLAEITAWQQDLVDFAERTRVVVLLDVPPGLPLRRVLAWRAAFDSSYAAVYGPWPRVPDPRGGQLVAVPPSALAAGVVARVERTAGLSRGPANVLLRGAVDVPSSPTAAEHDALHAAHVNLLRLDRDGVRLLAARTTSTTRAWRPLPTRRLLSMVERTLERQLAWAAFEPNDAALRGQLRMLVGSLLRGLHRSGAFAGATVDDSFFVRVAEGAAAAREADDGRLLCEIGLAPSEPAELLLVRLVRADDGLRAATAVPAGGVHG